MPKFGTKVPFERKVTRIPFSRSKVKVTKPINASTHRVPLLPNGKAYELQTWYTDGGRQPASTTST